MTKYKNLNIIKEAINEVIENILEENYRDINGNISDIRYGYYGDANEYYSYSDFGCVNLTLQKYKCLLSKCTYNYLEEKIKNIFELYIYYLKIINCMPKYIGTVPAPIGNPRLCIYYNGCNLNGDSVEFSIGVDIIYTNC